MIPLGNEFKRMIYAYEFADGHAYVGLTYNEKKRKYEHYYENKGPVAQHIEKSGLKPTYVKLHDYESVKIAAQLENDFINLYASKGWQMLNGSKGGALGGNEREWTFDKCLEIAKKYNKKEDLRFAPGLGGLYNAARKNGWWDEICAHMKGGNNKWNKSNVINAAKKCKYVGEFQKKYLGAYRAAKDEGYLDDVLKQLDRKLIKWNEELVFNEAKKYKTRAEFQKKSPGAYNYAYRKGILDKISAHMKLKNKP